jgi:capsular polysaccharide biosynthesis protein/Tfp pilus assembly protein PilF
MQMADETQALVEGAEALRARGLLDDAAAALTKALALDPNSYVARLHLAQVLRTQARYRSALEQLSRLTTEHPGRSEPWWLTAMICWDAGDRANAAVSAAQYAALLPQDASAQIRAAELLIDLGQHQKAAALVERALDLDPESAEASYFRGLLLFEDGRTEVAIEAYEHAVRLSPRLGEAAGGRVLEAWLIDFRSWTENSAAKYYPLEPRESLHLPAPSVIPAAEAGVWNSVEAQLPEIFVGKLENAEVLGREFPILAPDGCFFVDGFVTSPKVFPHKGGTVKYASRDGRVLLDLPAVPLETDGPCVLLGRSNNYFHFLLESLPRILSAEQVGSPGEAMALVPQGLAATQLELLNLLGFPQARLIALPADASIRCRTLYAPSLFSRTFAISPRAIEFLRHRVLGCFPRIPNLPKRIYLSRNRMPRRRVTNESELLTMLEESGFAVVYPENLRLDEQVRMFAQAEAILSPDSSALSNLAFASDGAKVGVFCSRERGLLKPLWHCIATLVGAHLTYIHADSILESSPTTAHRDMRIDPALLDEWLAVL